MLTVLVLLTAYLLGAGLLLVFDNRPWTRYELTALLLWPVAVPVNAARRVRERRRRG